MTRTNTVLLFAALFVFCAAPTLAGVRVLDHSSNVDVTVTHEGQGSLNSGSLGLDASQQGLTEVGPGVEFDSYLIQIHNFDSCSLEDYDASFAIDGPLLGIQTEIANLRPGRRTLNNNGFNARGPAGDLEINDNVELNGELLVSGRVGGQGVDTIRVFVAAAAVPEVASAAVWSTVFVAGLVACGRLRDENE